MWLCRVCPRKVSVIWCVQFAVGSWLSQWHCRAPITFASGVLRGPLSTTVSAALYVAFVLVPGSAKPRKPTISLIMSFGSWYERGSPRRSRASSPVSRGLYNWILVNTSNAPKFEFICFCLSVYYWRVLYVIFFHWRRFKIFKHLQIRFFSMFQHKIVW